MKHLKHFLAICFLFCLMVSNTIVVSADDTNPVIYVVAPPEDDVREGGGGAIFDACNSINETLITKRYLKVNFLEPVYDGNTCDITVDINSYNKLANSEQQKIMQIALDGIHDSNISRSTKTKIYNNLCEVDTTTASLVRQLGNDASVNIVGAYKYYLRIEGFIEFLLTIAVVVISLGLSFTLVIDIGYITVPFIQNWLDRRKIWGHNIASLEAVSAVKESMSKSGQEYVSPVGIYFKSKIKQFIALALCLLYIINGEVFSVIAHWIDYFRGFLM